MTDALTTLVAFLQVASRVGLLIALTLAVFVWNSGTRKRAARALWAWSYAWGAIVWIYAAAVLWLTATWWELLSVLIATAFFNLGAIFLGGVFALYRTDDTSIALALWFYGCAIFATRFLAAFVGRKPEFSAPTPGTEVNREEQYVDDEWRQQRYATHIRAAWKRLYPGSYARFEREGRLERLSHNAAAAAGAAFAMAREDTKSLLVGHSAAAETWALPPAVGWEWTKAVSVVIHHRWRRRWPALYARLDHDPVLAIEPTEQAIEGACADDADWFDVLPAALDTGAWIHDYVPQEVVAVTNVAGASPTEHHTARPEVPVREQADATAPDWVEYARQLVRGGVPPGVAIKEALRHRDGPMRKRSSTTTSTPSSAASHDRRLAEEGVQALRRAASDAKADPVHQKFAALATKHPPLSAEQHQASEDRMLAKAAKKFGRKTYPPLSKEDARKLSDQMLANAKGKFAPGSSRPPSTKGQPVNPRPRTTPEEFKKAGDRMLDNANKKFRKT